jgi:hypothetical protein
MTPAEFVTHWRTEKDGLVDLFIGTGSETLVSQKISSMNRHEFSRHSTAAENTAFRTQPATCHC